MVLLRILAVINVLFIIILTVLLYTPKANEIGRLIVSRVGGDQVLHILVGSGVTLSSALLIRLYRYSARNQVFFWIIWLLLFIADECFQKFSYVRNSNIDDVTMSFLGWLIACSLWWLLVLYGVMDRRKLY